MMKAYGVPAVEFDIIEPVAPGSRIACVSGYTVGEPTAQSHPAAIGIGYERPQL
jgi:hypothetical protein